MKRMLLVLALAACSSPAPAEPAVPTSPAPLPPAPAPVPLAPAPGAPAPEAPPATSVLQQLAAQDDALGGTILGGDDTLGGGVGGFGGLGGGLGGGAPAISAVPTLESCFPATLEGLSPPPPMAGFDDGLFTRAYLERRIGGRSININVWDAVQNDIASELTQYPVIGRDGAERAGTGITRTGGHHEGHASESDWEEVSGGEHRDSFTVRVSDTRLVSLRIQPATERGEAERVFRTLDLACLESAPLR